MKGTKARQLKYQNYTDLIDKATQIDVKEMIEVLRNYFSGKMDNSSSK